jgi:putative methionine-R-sulfoxide reductase with GAF domain
MAHDPRHDAVYAFLANQRDQLIRLEAQLRQLARPHDVAWAVADFAGRVLMLDDCVVYLTQPDGQSLLQYAAYGPKRIAERIFENRIRLPFGEGVVGSCAQLGVAQRIDDTRADSRYVVDDLERLSEIAVPILDGAHVLGVIDSEHADAAFYRREHVAALSALAETAAKRLRVLFATSDPP